MSRYLAISNNIIVDIVELEKDFEKSDSVHEFDTVVTDNLSLYTVGETYNIDDYVRRYPPLRLTDAGVDSQTGAPAQMMYIPSDYVVSYSENINQYPIKNLYISSNFTTDPYLDQIWNEIAKVIGINVVSSPAEYNLILTDTSAYNSAGTINNYISVDSFNQLTDRISQQELQLPVLPAVVPRVDSDLDSFGDVPIFVKHRRTYGKSTNKFAYTLWNSPSDLRKNIVDGDLWEYQNNPLEMIGELIIVPAITQPLLVHSVSFSVNENSEVLFLRTHTGFTQKSGEYLDGEIYPYVDPIIQTNISNICLNMGVKGGIHEVEFALYNDQLVLLDWNPRPGFGNSATGRDIKSGVMVAALAHMVGLPVPTLNPYYTIQRNYADLNLSSSLCVDAQQSGILARCQRDRLYSLAYTGQTKQDCVDALNNFESRFNITRNSI